MLGYGVISKLPQAGIIGRLIDKTYVYNGKFTYNLCVQRLTLSMPHIYQGSNCRCKYT